MAHPEPGSAVGSVRVHQNEPVRGRLEHQEGEPRWVLAGIGIVDYYYYSDNNNKVVMIDHRLVFEIGRTHVVVVVVGSQRNSWLEMLLGRDREEG